jgi:hypothetical protein
MMPALREIFAEYDIEFDKRRNLQRGNRAVTRLRSALQRMRPAVTSAAAALAGIGTAATAGAVAGIQRIVSSTIESTREIDRWAGRLNLSGDTLRSWTSLASEFGADIDDVTDAFKELQLKAQDAIQGGTEQREVFRMMGISMSDLRANVDDMEGLMGLFTRGLDRMTSSSERARVVDELMSDSGTRMIQVLTLGTDEIQRRTTAISQAAGPTAELTRAVQEHSRRVRAVTRRWERFKRELTARILPIIGQLSEKISEFEEPARRMIQTVARIIQETNILKGVLVGVGVVAVGVAVATIGAWGPMVAAFVGIAAAVAAVAVAFDQISRAVDGSGSALQEFLEHEDRLGPGGVQGVVLLLSDTWENMTRNISNATGALVEFGETIQPVLDALQSVWEMISFISGGFGLADVVREQILPEGVWGTLRGAAQNRLEEERERETTARDVRAAERGRSLVNQDIAAEESGVSAEGLALGPSGLPISVPTRREIPVIPRSPRIEETRLPRVETRNGQPISIDSPWTLNIDISEATDAEEVRRTVTQEITQAQSRWVSEIESLISDQTEVGT